MRILSSLSIILFSISLFAQVNMGLNLSDVGNAATQWMLNDAFKQSSGWFSREAGTQDFGSQMDIPIPMDSNGYPLYVPFRHDGTNYEVHVIMLNSQPEEYLYPSGDYTLIFEGTGTVRIDWDVEMLEFENGGTYTVAVDNPTTLGLQLVILESDTSDPIRNIHFILPGYEEYYETNLFTDEFIDFIEPFQTLRFMKPLAAEDNPIENWEDRTMPTDYTYYMDIEDTVRPGLPYEMMIQLVNEEGKDFWLNIPYRANDDYVRKLATKLRNELQNDVKFYLEYANEAWNGDYPQTYNYCVEGALAEGWGTTDTERNNYFFTGRSIQIFEIFDSVFAGQTDRVLTVLASQAYDLIAGQIRDAYNDPEVNPNNYVVDYFSYAPYFANEIILTIEQNEGTTCGWTIEEFMDTIESSLISEMNELVMLPKAVADDMNLPVVAYEAGHGIGMFRELDSCAARLCSLANMHPRMQDIYCTYFDYWADSVGDGVINTFVASEAAGTYGSYGLVESIYQDPETSPKWVAHRDCGGIGVSTDMEGIESRDLAADFIQYLGAQTFQLKPGDTYKVYNIMGVLLQEGSTDDEIIIDQADGIYLVKTKNHGAHKVFVH